MKTIKFLFAAALTMLMFSACSPDVIDEDLDPMDEAEPDYLVMLYATGGGNLDANILQNVMQLLYEGSSSKVKYTVQYKLSADEQEMYDKEFGGVRRLTGTDNLALKSKSGKLPSLPKNYGQTLAAIKSERFADKQYDVTTREALADFIRWSKQKYPEAKRTILIINDHGSGWELDKDGKQDATTRAILFDDNTSMSFLTAGDVANGVKDAGGVDMIYTDACLMSMYENLYAYADACKYLLSAVETTPGLGGNYMMLLRLLKSAGNTEEGLETAMHRYVDYSTSKEWWGRNKSAYSDLGFYNLQKFRKACTPVLNKIAETLAEKFESDESIMPTVENPTFERWFTAYIRIAVNNCMATYATAYIPSRTIPSFIPYLEKDGIKPDEDGDFLCRDLIEWSVYALTDGAQEAYEDNPELFLKLQRLVTTSGQRAFSFTDMLRVLDRELDAVGAQNNPFKPLRAELLAAIKSAAYISCTKPDSKPGIDQEYELCSPAIFIAPLNEALLSEEYPSYQKNISTIEDGIRYYQSTVFDQQVGWSRFLQVLDVVPDAVNPTRKHVK